MACVVCAVSAQIELRMLEGSAQMRAADSHPKRGAVMTLAMLWTALEGVITGHSPRRMGAQLLASLGVPDAVICWFGRWGSSAIKAYREDARSRSRPGKRIWGDALAADAAPHPVFPLLSSWPRRPSGRAW